MPPERSSPQVVSRPPHDDETSTRTDERLAPLRGARVSADVRRVGQVALGLGLAAVVALIVVLCAAGVRKNSQIDELRDHGVPVRMTVTSCLGLLGGSGSNPAGYSCHGTFRMGGRIHDDPIPGNTLYGPGSTLRGISVVSDPALFTTPAVLRSEHASARVYVLPAALTAAVVLAAAGLVVFGRRRAA